MSATNHRAWRLLIDPPLPGSRNMAIDRAILEAHAAGAAPSTVRLYRWARPTVSLGRFQREDGVDAAAVVNYDLDMCRRPTGGRGVLHDDELTYTIVSGVADGLPRGVTASYRMLCGALVEAYRDLGVEAVLTSGRRGDSTSAACYLHATAADLSLGAAKLSGSAQVWSGTSCLQHGSFVISRDTVREAAVFRLDDVGTRRLAESTQTITDALGERPPDDELVRAVRSGFERALGIVLVPAALTDDEQDRAGALEASFDLRPASWT